MEDQIIALLPYTIPSIITGLVAYYFFLNHTKSEEKRMKGEILKVKHKDSLQFRLQAYERMILFMERINPAKILLRVTPLNDNVELYEQHLIQHIEQEFEHNLAQQIYISDACWNALIASKNATIHIIKQTVMEDGVNSAQNLRESILKRMIESAPPSQTGIAFLKEEVRELF